MKYLLSFFPPHFPQPDLISGRKSQRKTDNKNNHKYNSLVFYLWVSRKTFRSAEVLSNGKLKENILESKAESKQMLPSLCYKFDKSPRASSILPLSWIRFNESQVRSTNNHWPSNRKQLWYSPNGSEIRKFLVLVEYILTFCCDCLRLSIRCPRTTFLYIQLHSISTYVLCIWRWCLCVHKILLCLRQTEMQIQSGQ